MKRILLSVAIIATSISGINAQCTQADVPTVTEEFNSISSTFLTDETNSITVLSHNQEAAPDDGGYGDFRADETIGVMNMATGVNYMAKLYTKSPRVPTYRAVLIDYGNTGDYEVLASTVGAGTWSWQSQGKMYFVIPEGKSGNATLRYVVGKDDGITTGDNYLTTCNGVAVGEVHDYAVTFPSAFPPVATDDFLPVLQNSTDVELDVFVNDNEGSSAVTSVEITQQPVNGTASVVNNKIIYTPTADYRGVDFLKYTITSSVGTSDAAGTKVTVYGNKGDVLIIEDFDTPDESLEGVITDDNVVFNWDGSFAFAITPTNGNSSSSKSNDDGESFGDNGGSMLIGMAHDEGTTEPLVVNDSYVGRKVKNGVAGAYTALPFSASDVKHTLGMQVMITEHRDGMKFGFAVRELETGSVRFVKIDASSLVEWEWSLISLDLTTIEVDGAPTTYTGEYVLHSLGYQVNSDTYTSPFFFYVDEIGLYPSESLSNNNVELDGVSVYPNPVKNTLNITAGKNAKVSVFNAIGSVIYNGNSKTIDTQSWNKGIYFVVIKEGAKSKTVKVIK